MAVIVISSRGAGASAIFGAAVAAPESMRLLLASALADIRNPFKDDIVKSIGLFISLLPSLYLIMIINIIVDC
ncbi:hypothetical protein GCM10017044_06150 [Kordiimonas sediminis]|uniref:Uncharacterized protein n=1 Tax=Kordiimonas sediminis TaxID=1735581 RepID=A0A919AMZ9_9PROT|nr:hypothetical protein GCM10017044_06150 [Kordiimonas sediminis]